LKRSTDRLWKAHGEILGETKRIADEEFVATHPPRIRIKHIWLDENIWDGQEIKIKIRIVNVGKTLAQVLEGQVRVLVREADRMLPNWPKMPEPLRFVP